MIHSVLFASIYRFTTLMQFDMADTMGILARACTWCVVEIACGIISACLPTLRPLMLLVSSQFNSTRNRSSKGVSTLYSSGGRSCDTELVTIGGTGGKRDQKFERLGDDNASSFSGDERPLAGK